MMNFSAARSVFSLVRMPLAASALMGLLVLGAPLAAFANQTVTVTLSSTAPASPAHTALNPIPITAAFSEPVRTFDGRSITVSNGTVTSVIASSTNADVYTIDVAPTANGTTTVSFAGNAITAKADPAHTNSPSNILEFVADSGAGGATPPVASSTQAFLSLSVYSGTPGTVFNAVGTNFWASESVHVGFDGATSTVTADASGDFTAPFTAGADQSGASQITAIGITSGLVATNSFYVNPASGSTSSSTIEGTSSGTSSPSLAVTAGPANNSSTNKQSVTFNFTTDSTATTVCSFDVASNNNPSSFACGSPVTLGSTTSSTTLPLGDGQYKFVVTATNAAHTGSTTISRTFTVDTVVPVIAEVTPVATPNNGIAAQYTFTSTKNGTINLGGGCTLASPAITAGTSTITFNTLASGTYNCTLSVTDAAGNVSNMLTLASFTVTAPVTTTTTTSSGNGGGGGGGYVASGPLSIGYVNTSGQTAAPVPVTTPAAPSTGQVLGASTYNFTRPLSAGSTGEDVTQLQIILIAGGFLAIAKPTGYYGSLTAAAVRAYQTAHGISPVGVVGPQTRAVLNQGSTGAASGGEVKGASAYNFETNLTVGSIGAGVTALQHALTAAGVYTGPVTGYFGSLTRAAVKAYQTSKGISSTGYVGPLTRAALNQGQ